MKFIIRSLIFCLLFLVSNPVQSQVPGYMGKRFSVHYEPQFWYSFIFDQVDIFHNASLEYVVSLKHVLGVRYGFSGLQTEFSVVEIPNGTVDLYDVKGLVRSHSVTVFGKFFNKKRGFIAPAGGYTSYGAAVVYNKSFVSKDKFPLEEGDVLDKYTDFVLYLGEGRQFIFGDRLILNIALQLGVPTVSVFKFKTGLETGDIYSRVFFASIFRAQVGFGFLAF